MSQQYDYLYKILLIGSSSVGKSSLILRFSDDLFKESFQPTVGVDFKIKNVKHQNSSIKLQIWDTAGQQRYRTITSSYYKGVHGIILVYDVTNRQTFDDITNWFLEADNYTKGVLPKFLVGNKRDLRESREVSEEQGKNLAESLGMQFLETSAKEAINVEEAFLSLSTELMMGAINYGPKKQTKKTLKIDLKKNKKASKGCC